MQTITTIGLDIAKSVFQVHGVDAQGQVIIRRQLKRRYVLAFFQKLALIIRDVPKRFLGVQARDRVSLCGDTLEVLRVFIKHIELRLNERGQAALVEFTLPMTYAFDPLELDEHDEPVGRRLRPASSGKHHGDQNGADTNAPAVQSKTSGDMAHADAPLGAVAIALGWKSIIFRVNEH